MSIGKFIFRVYKNHTEIRFELEKRGLKLKEA